MTENKCMEGKVLAVTGAGRGIGREIALMAAQQGASVVVNDLGGGADGDGSDLGPAQQVVEEIVAAGGKAVANGASVAEPEGAQSIIDSAVQNFGRIDSIVNNAGILRDRIFHRMSIVDFEMVIKVHLFGAFYMAKAAAPHFKEQQSGSMVHFTSTSGLIGGIGQANYAAAKMGIVGLSKVIAMDMERYNVRSNCIAPFAWSRLIGTIPTETEEEALRVKKLKEMGPEKIAPLAVYLASDLSQDVSGQIFASRKNEIFLFSQNRPVRSAHRDGGWTPQTIANHGMPAMKPDMYPLQGTGEIFSWEAV